MAIGWRRVANREAGLADRELGAEQRLFVGALAWLDHEVDHEQTQAASRHQKSCVGEAHVPVGSSWCMSE
jgi:hypothetical protein